MAFIFALGVGRGPGSTLIGNCPIWIDQLQPIHLVLLTSTAGETGLEIPLLGIQGGPAYVQALVWSSGATLGTTEALSIVIGG